MIGAGAGSTIIAANGLSRIFNVQSSTSTFAGLTVRKVVATGDSGGIDSDRDDNSLTLIRSPNGASGLSA